MWAATQVVVDGVSVASDEDLLTVKQPHDLTQLYPDLTPYHRQVIADKVTRGAKPDLDWKKIAF